MSGAVAANLMNGVNGVHHTPSKNLPAIIIGDTTTPPGTDQVVVPVEVENTAAMLARKERVLKERRERRARARKEVHEFYVLLGQHIEEHRKAMGWTQAELARHCKVSQQTIFAYERGDRKVPVIMLIRMAKAFQADVQDMMALKAIEPKKKKTRLSPRARRLAFKLQGLKKTEQRVVQVVIESLELNNQRQQALAA